MSRPSSIIPSCSTLHTHDAPLSRLLHSIDAAVTMELKHGVSRSKISLMYRLIAVQYIVWGSYLIPCCVLPHDQQERPPQSG